MKTRPGPALYRLEVMVTDAAGTPPEGFALKDYAEQSFGVFQEELEDIELRFSPSAARDAHAYLFHPTHSMTDETDGSMTVRLRAGGLLQMVQHLMTWGDAVTINAPAKLQDLIRKEVETLYRHHGGVLSNKIDYVRNRRPAAVSDA